MKRIPNGIHEIGYSLVAVIAALAISGILIWLSGYDILEAYYNLYYGAFGNIYNVANMLLNATPLIFTGLSVAFALKAGLFNVGAEGQLYAGALASALVGVHFAFLPFPLHALTALAAGALAGGLWALLPGYLRARTGAHEVVTTIMMNYAGILLTTYLVKAYFKDPGPVDQTPFLKSSARLPELIPDTRLSVAFIIAVVVVVLVDIVLKRSVLGYEIQAVGSNRPAAECAGIDAGKRLAVTMVISGAIAGLAGSSVVLGVLGRFITNFSPGYGFTGIAVAVLGRSKPWGVLPAALLFGALQSGGMAMQLFTSIPSDLMTIVQGIVILFVAAPGIGSLIGRLRSSGRARRTARQSTN